MNITIKKATIKDGNFLSVEYTEQQADGSSVIKKDCKIKIHADLKTAFSGLTKHLADLCFQYDNEGEINYNEITCIGFSMGGNGDSEGVTLFGNRTLVSDKVLNLVSPFQRFDSDFYHYSKIENLCEKLEQCKLEVYEYLFNGKHAPDNQLALFEELEETI